jgi:hypothetical protein
MDSVADPLLGVRPPAEHLLSLGARQLSRGRRSDLSAAATRATPNTHAVLARALIKDISRQKVHSGNNWIQKISPTVKICLSRV